MGHSYTGVGGLGDFTVVKSNPTGNTVRFTVTDASNKLTTTKMIRAVLCDAIDQFIAAERADLNTNADDDVKGSSEFVGVGEGFSSFNFNFGSKYADVALTALTNIAATGDITASIPYADTI